jgi:uncharacterized protein YcbK (DUF882 family)
MVWRYFTKAEFECRCGCGGSVDDDFIDKLDTLREKVGFALPVTSGYRCPEHNAKISSTGRDGPHTKRRAVDLLVDRKRAYEVARVAFLMGFTGIGFQQKGTARFVHLDDLPDEPGQPRPTTWSY